MRGIQVQTLPNARRMQPECRSTGMGSWLHHTCTACAPPPCRYACSTAVNELPGRNQGSEVVIQGRGAVESLGDFLVKAFGIPKRYVEVKK